MQDAVKTSILLSSLLLSADNLFNFYIFSFHLLALGHHYGHAADKKNNQASSTYPHIKTSSPLPHLYVPPCCQLIHHHQYNDYKIEILKDATWHMFKDNIGHREMIVPCLIHY